MAYDFDRVIERRHTESSKWRKYGEDVIPLWVADMDFASPAPVIRALRERVEHGVFGYGYNLERSRSTTSSPTVSRRSTAGASSPTRWC